MAFNSAQMDRGLWWREGYLWNMDIPEIELPLVIG